MSNHPPEGVGSEEVNLTRRQKMNEKEFTTKLVYYSLNRTDMQ